MRNRTFIPVLLFTVLAFSAPRGAAAFEKKEPASFLQETGGFRNSALQKGGWLLFSKAAPAVPETPAPAAAVPKACKPFLLSVSVGGVSERVVLERSCTPENDTVWALAVERGDRRVVSVKVSSDKYPADRAKLESRIKSMVADGIGQEDADFIVQKTGPALKKAELAKLEEKSAILAEATEALEAHLVNHGKAICDSLH